PHHRKNAELGQVRLTAEERQYALVFVGLEAVTFEDLRVNHLMAIALTMDSKIARPSTPPSSGSQARSGCGIMPTTFRASLQMPAIACTDPFGFQPSSRAPSGPV